MKAWKQKKPLVFPTQSTSILSMQVEFRLYYHWSEQSFKSLKSRNRALTLCRSRTLGARERSQCSADGRAFICGSRSGSALQRQQRPLHGVGPPCPGASMESGCDANTAAGWGESPEVLKVSQICSFVAREARGSVGMRPGMGSHVFCCHNNLEPDKEGNGWITIYCVLCSLSLNPWAKGWSSAYLCSTF